MPSRRIFIGAFVRSEEFLKRYEDIQRQFQDMTDGRWAAPHNLHLTMKFIGSVEEERIAEIGQLLDGILSVHRDEVFYGGLGCFPDPRSPKIIWAGMHNPSGLLFHLNEEIESRLEKLGYPREAKKFIPHITLRRIREKYEARFAAELEKFSHYELGRQASYTIQIIESRMAPGGSEYQAIEGMGG